MRASVVSFTPGARTAWHTHPVEQTLDLLTGVGRICFKGEPPQALNPGDTVTTAGMRSTGMARARPAVRAHGHVGEQ